MTPNSIYLKHVTAAAIEGNYSMVSPTICLVGARTCVQAAAGFQVFAIIILRTVSVPQPSLSKQYTDDKIAKITWIKMGITRAQITNDFLYLSSR